MFTSPATRGRGIKATYHMVDHSQGILTEVRGPAERNSPAERKILEKTNGLVTRIARNIASLFTNLIVRN